MIRYLEADDRDIPIVRSTSLADLPAAVLQSFLDDVATGRLRVPLHRTYTLDQITTAHADMEANNASGKLVVLL